MTDTNAKPILMDECDVAAQAARDTRDKHFAEERHARMLQEKARAHEAQLARNFALADKLVPIAPLGPRELERVERPDAKPDEDGHCCVCGLAWPDEKETLEPHVCPPGFLQRDYTATPIDGANQVKVTLPGGRSFQLLGKPTQSEIECAIAGYHAGCNHGHDTGMRKARNIMEGAVEEIDGELKP